MLTELHHWENLRHPAKRTASIYNYTCTKLLLTRESLKNWIMGMQSWFSKLTASLAIMKKNGFKQERVKSLKYLSLGLSNKIIKIMKIWLDRASCFYVKSSEISTVLNITWYALLITFWELAKFDLSLALLEDSHWGINNWRELRVTTQKISLDGKQQWHLLKRS